MAASAVSESPVAPGMVVGSEVASSMPELCADCESGINVGAADADTENVRKEAD